jgi:flagellar motility protein MotE (MotC chaperone)
VIHDDASLTPQERGAILKTIAQEQAAAYSLILAADPQAGARAPEGPHS